MLFYDIDDHQNPSLMPGFNCLEYAEEYATKKDNIYMTLFFVQSNVSGLNSDTSATRMCYEFDTIMRRMWQG